MLWCGSGFGHRICSTTSNNCYFVTSGKQTEDLGELDKILAELASIETRLEEVDLDDQADKKGEIVSACENRINKLYITIFQGRLRVFFSSGIQYDQS